jgi:hypothetical protein
MEVATHEWPIVSITTKTKQIDNQIYENFKKNLLECMQLCSDKNQQCVLIIDISTIKFDPTTISYANRMNRFRNKIEGITTKYVQHLFIVVKNRHIRNMFKFFSLHELQQKFYYIVKSPEKVKKKLRNSLNFECDNDEVLDDDSTKKEYLDKFKEVAQGILC